jgi:hypothetical protein
MAARSTNVSRMLNFVRRYTWKPRRIIGGRFAGLPPHLYREGDFWPSRAPDVPECPPGFETRPPDFVGVGAEKAGTTWWYSLLASHPKVHHPEGRRKEMHIFDSYWHRPMDQLRADEYGLHFPRPPGTVAGEWTPRYILDYWTPPLLKRSAPDTKLLLLLRDPLDRYRSAIVQDLTSNGIRHARVATTAALGGLYFQQLSRLLRHFDEEQLLILQYEQCILEPASQFDRTLEFVGLDKGLISPVFADRVHKTLQPKPDLDAVREHALLEFYEQDLALFFEHFGQHIDANLWPSCARLGLV